MKPMSVVYSAMGLMALMILLGLYWVIFPIRVFELKHPIEVIHAAPIPVGHTLLFRMDYCKYVDTAAEVHFSLVGEVRYDLSGVMASVIPRGCHVVEQGLMVPPVPSGVYHLEMLRIYAPNPLKTLQVRSESNSFEVVN